MQAGLRMLNICPQSKKLMRPLRSCVQMEPVHRASPALKLFSDEMRIHLSYSKLSMYCRSTSGRSTC
eukprot:1152084-Pelagomonas_calceolata.AAC.3